MFTPTTGLYIILYKRKKEVCSLLVKLNRIVPGNMGKILSSYLKIRKFAVHYKGAIFY